MPMHGSLWMTKSEELRKREKPIMSTAVSCKTAKSNRQSIYILTYDNQHPKMQVKKNKHLFLKQLYMTAHSTVTI